MTKYPENFRVHSSKNFSDSPVFWNFSLDKGRLKTFVSWFLKNYGEKKTLELLEQLKELGFGYATKAGISLGIEDLKVPPKKPDLLGQAEFNIFKTTATYQKGNITGIEKMQNFIETWHETSENLKQEVVQHFEKTDVLNPVYMMAFSGARGNLSQVRQLVGMRGLMADPQGKIIDFPIQSNFREGLTLTEYLISTYGARKGIVDTALRTATAGYLTRRLVDVAQHVIVSKFDCGTKRGIFLFDMKEGVKTIYAFQNRLTGRVLAQDIFVEPGNTSKANEKKGQISKLASRNQEIHFELALAISKLTKKALVRSPLTCETRKLVCQLCYGWSLSTSRLVSIGEAVGVIAGQSIGEPGTQLTMRTFHTGGVFAGNITEQIHAPFSGYVEYEEPIAGSFIRTPQGNLVFFTKAQGTLLFKESQNPISFQSSSQDSSPSKSVGGLNVYKIPAFTILSGRHGQWMEKGTLLAQVSALPTGQKTTQTIEQTIYSSLEGEVYYNQMDLLEDLDEKYGERISKAEDWSKVWVLSAKIVKDPFNASFFPIHGDFVSKSSILNEIEWKPPFPQSFSVDSTFLTPSNSSVQYSSFSNLRKNISSNHFERLEKSFFKNFSTQSESSAPFISENPVLASHFQILSKYTIRKKFLNVPSKDPTSGNAFSPFAIREKTLNSENIQMLKTYYGYPYQKIRLNFVKTISQTSLSLPPVPSGKLAYFLNELKPFKNSIFTPKFSNLPLQNQSKVFLKKLTVQRTLKKVQQVLPLEKQNLFQPLVLTSFLPFCLTLKTSVPSVKKTKCFSTVSLFKLNGLPNSREFPSLKKDFQQVFSKFMFKKYGAQNPFETKTLKKLLKEQKTKNFSLKHLKNISSTPSKFAFPLEKREHLSLKSPVFSLTPTNIRYEKLGYFVSFSQEFLEKDTFLSFLPLQGEPEEVPNQSSKVSFNLQTKKTNSSSLSFQNVRSLNALGLKNTDQWSPSPVEGFSWFPSFSQTKTHGIFLFLSPTQLPKTFAATFEKSKLKTGSSLKNFFLETTKYLPFLNLAQSQHFRKSWKIQNLSAFDRTVKSPLKFPLNSVSTKKWAYPHKTLISLQKKECLKSFQKESFKKSLKQKNRKTLKNFQNTPLVVQPPLNFCHKFHTSKQLKNVVLKNFSLEQVHRVMVPKKSLENFKTSLLNPIEQKDFIFPQNKFLFSKNLKQFNFKRAHSEKLSVFFHEVYSLSQQNYLVNQTVFPSNCQNQTNKRIQFFTPKPSYGFSKTSLTASIVNAQGVKKTVSFPHDGLVEFKPMNKKNVQNNLELQNPSFGTENFYLSLKKYQNLSFEKRHSIAEGQNFPASISNTSLRVNFLNYLKMRKKVKTQPKNQKKSGNNFVKNKTIFSSLERRKNFLSWIPFQFKNQIKTPQSFPQKTKVQTLTLPFTPVQTMNAKWSLTLKQGWIYKTLPFSVAFNVKNRWVNSGKIIFEDVQFEQQKVFVERILDPQTKFKKTYQKIIYFEKNHAKTFNVSVSKLQKNGRFFKIQKVLEQPYFEMPNTLFLIRPATHQLLPNTYLMKTRLYKSMATKNSMKSSYSVYQNYFSEAFNLQNIEGKTLSSFAPLDLTVSPIQHLNFSSLKKTSLTFKNVSKETKQKNFPLNFKRGSTFVKNLEFPKKRNLFKSLRSSENLYFANHPINFFSLNVSLNLPQKQMFSYAFPTILLKTLKPEEKGLKSTGSERFVASFLKNEYLNLLLLRNREKTLGKNRSNHVLATSKTQAHAFKNSKPRIDASENAVKISLQNASKHKIFKVSYPKMANLDSMMKGFSFLPFFEYSFIQKYSFFANQRLFASYFYKQHFKNNLKLAVFSGKKVSEESFFDKRFLEKDAMHASYLDALRNKLVSKNFLMLNSENFQKNVPLGFTSFYSPFQGEILKIYAHEKNMANLKKGMNMYLEPGMLTERQFEKLILTKADIFSLDWPTQETQKETEKVNFFQTEPGDANVSNFFETKNAQTNLKRLEESLQNFQKIEERSRNLTFTKYNIPNFGANYKNKKYKLKSVSFEFPDTRQKLRLGEFIQPGHMFDSKFTFLKSGQIIHLNPQKFTLRKAEFFSISPQAILHTYNGHCLTKNSPVMTLPFQTLKTGDIVQGIPKVEQYLEARTSIQGRLFLNSLPVLLHAIYQRYALKFSMEQAVRQSFLKIQQILVDGVQRVYRSQGVSIADKHLEVIVRQMTSKVRIIHGGQTGFFPGELVDLEFVERMNCFLMVKIRYEPIVLGITKASLEVDSFLSAASFQQTTKILTRSAIENKRDFLKGLKENLLVGNLLPAGTGYVVPLETKTVFKS